ncbi:MAG: DUF4198 domain-containing protein [Proteobacteria bacterium]|nr:MAG: DUF4198 domain-containing protein [Pseudomonadota bacterium]
MRLNASSARSPSKITSSDSPNDGSNSRNSRRTASGGSCRSRLYRLACGASCVLSCSDPMPAIRASALAWMRRVNSPVKSRSRSTIAGLSVCASSGGDNINKMSRIGTGMKKGERFIARRLVTGLWLLLLPAIGHAHNFWLESHPFRADVDSRVDISVHVGIDMRGQALPNIPKWYTDFSFVDADGRHDVRGELGRDPAGFVWVRTPGVFAAGYHSDRKFVDIEPELFRTYLLEEGLEKVIAAREQAGEGDSPVREIYSRCVKTLYMSGDGAGNEYFRESFGYPLELTPVQNPYRRRGGDLLEFELLYRGEPLAGAQVTALRKAAPETAYKARTDARGRARLVLPEPGVWQVKAVEMIPAGDTDADWESFWASVTFELAP